MLPGVHPAVAFVLGLAFALFFLVVTQPGTPHTAFAFFSQITEFTLGEQAALAHVVGVNGGIHVRCQVDVVGCGQVQPFAVAVADTGRQETGLTAIVDREINVGGVEHRNVFHPQGHVGGAAETCVRVQGDVVALQVPVVAAGGAAGIAAVF